MPIVKPEVRSSPLKMFFLIILSITCVFVLVNNSEIFFQILNFRDLTSILLLCFVVLSVASLANIFHLLMFFGFEYISHGQSSQMLQQLWNHLSKHVYLLIALCLDIAGCCFLLLYPHTELKLHWRYFLVSFSASILSACILLLVDYDDVELSSSQKMKTSIGYTWACGAYTAFYKKYLIDITKRMSNFEKEKGITLLVKKLVCICPLSCNANGTLEGKDGDLEYFGSLKEISVDEGGANNRNYKTNVYKIHGPFETYIAAEIPSPLATLYEMRDKMDSIILEYHRDCFVETLKNLTKSENCVILEYDDLSSDSPEKLHSFLLSKLEDKKFVNGVK